MDVIGITGGIGSGKSTVSNYLRSLGYEIIDADGISRQLTGAGSPILKELGAAFGGGIFTQEGDLDRKKLAEIVFCDPAKNRLLQSIVTVKVKESVEEPPAAVYCHCEGEGNRRGQDPGFPGSGRGVCPVSGCAAAV
ncbi:dephospho-CoA kinase [Eubacterium pyruvativorans]|uniref:dephospho-CoA kinase n=1 Tax=Eubacterium pyruvativorans TaxID=155865 RepID=UPI00156A0A66|nr:dephospho-CoA kinase [Eubacterium pyruvativorans]